jgi:prepilin-type processing-associated H-X9-DG protein
MSTPAPRFHPAALASFLLGLASFVLFGLTGVPALVLGLRGLRAVNTSEGRLRGARLAVAGMVLGGVGTLVTAAGIAALFVVRWQYAGLRATCANNLREMGVALNKYAEAHKSFPPATHDPAGLPPERRISWLADVLPLLAEDRPVNKAYRGLEERIDRARAWDEPANEAALNTPVRAFLCPGHPDFDPGRRPGLTHYVGVAGVGVRAAYLYRRDPNAGMFGHGPGIADSAIWAWASPRRTVADVSLALWVARSPITGHGRGVRPADITGGISYTLMVLETAHENGPWLAGDFPTVRGLDPKVEQYVGPGRPFGGLHPRIMNVLWVDGSVRPISEDVPAALLRRQATIRRDER